MKGRFFNFVFKAPIGKFFGRACLIVFLIFIIVVIREDSIAIRSRLSKLFLLSNIIAERDGAKFYARFGELVFLKPSFIDLFAFEANPKEVDPKVLNTYVEFYEKVITNFPNSADGYTILGFCHYFMGDESKAIEMFQKTITLNSKFFPAYYNLGLIHFRQGQYSKAIDFFKKALVIRSADRYKMTSSFKTYQFMYNENNDFLDTVPKRIKAGYRDGYVLLIDSWHKTKDFSQMFKDSLYAIKARLDDNGIFYYYAGVAAYELKEYRKAITFLKQYSKINVNDSDAAYYRGLSLRGLKKEREAKTFFKKAVELQKAQGIYFNKIDNINLRIL